MENSKDCSCGHNSANHDGNDCRLCDCVDYNGTSQKSENTTITETKILRQSFETSEAEK